MSEELQEQPAAAAPTEVVEAPKTEAPKSIEQTMQEVYEKNYPDTRVTRDATGKFQSTEKAAEPAAEETSQEPVAEKTETKPSISRPQSWSADLDEWWASLPPERQDFLSKREGETHSKIMQLGERAKAAEQYQAVLDRYRHVLGNNAPEREIESLLSTKDALLKDPQGSIQWLAQQLGVDLSKLVPQIGGDPEDARLTPLTQKIAQLERQLAETTRNISAREQAEMQAREQTLTTSIEKFAEGKDYWPDIENEVYTQVLALRQADPARALSDPLSVLKDAHDRAIRLTPAVQAKLDKAEREKAAAEKTVADKRKADEAKRAASLNVKSANGTSPKASFKNMEDEMAAIYDRLSAG